MPWVSEVVRINILYMLHGTHCTGETGKMAKEIPVSAFKEFAKTQGKHREFSLVKL